MRVITHVDDDDRVLVPTGSQRATSNDADTESVKGQKVSLVRTTSTDHAANHCTRLTKPSVMGVSALLVLTILSFSPSCTSHVHPEP
eukprot:33570-Eustigmatos_ZCMA.PRE.1